VRNVPAFVLQKDLMAHEAPRLSEVYRRSHVGRGVMNGIYKVCVGGDGKVTGVTPVKSIEGADDEVAESIRETWRYKPQASALCALVPVPLEVK
jgi:protein TonB